MATAPLQFQPTIAAEDIVGYIVGTNNVGDEDVDAVGAVVGAAVGLDGQLTMPCLNVQREFASIICWSDTVGATVGCTETEGAIDGDIEGAIEGSVDG